MTLNKLALADIEPFDAHWNAFCDADHGDYPEGFIEACERLGLAELVPVTEEALGDFFASERGIEPGGEMWSLTPKGSDAWKAALTKSRAAA